MVGRDWGDGSLGKVFSVQALGPEFKSLTFTQLKKKERKAGHGGVLIIIGLERHDRAIPVLWPACKWVSSK